MQSINKAKDSKPTKFGWDRDGPRQNKQTTKKFILVIAWLKSRN